MTDRSQTSNTAAALSTQDILGRSYNTARRALQGGGAGEKFESKEKGQRSKKECFSSSRLVYLGGRISGLQSWHCSSRKVSELPPPTPPLLPNPFARALHSDTPVLTVEVHAQF
jgi:hypothetical protein